MIVKLSHDEEAVVARLRGHVGAAVEFLRECEVDIEFGGAATRGWLAYAHGLSEVEAGVVFVLAREALRGAP